MLDEQEVFAQALSNKPVEATKVDEMEVLFESKKTFTVGTESVTIRPFSFGELPIVISLLKGVGSIFAHHQKQGTVQSVEGIMDIIGNGGENLIQALALNTGKERKFFDTMSPEDGVTIMQEFLMMNIGFFMKRVLPAIKGMK